MLQCATADWWPNMDLAGQDRSQRSDLTNQSRQTWDPTANLGHDPIQNRHLDRLVDRFVPRSFETPGASLSSTSSPSSLPPLPPETRGSREAAEPTRSGSWLWVTPHMVGWWVLSPYDDLCPDTTHGTAEKWPGWFKRGPSGAACMAVPWSV